MYLIRPYRTGFGFPKVHHRSNVHPLETSNVTTCGVDAAGSKWVGSFKEIDCKNCLAILTGVRRSPAPEVEQLSLLGGDE